MSEYEPSKIKKREWVWCDGCGKRSFGVVTDDNVRLCPNCFNHFDMVEKRNPKRIYDKY
jgi:acetyl-CoA carboxylase beta subunit